jgi:hypothetical protein
MTKDEFRDLRIEDKVVLTNHGKNKGKMGIVKDIIRGPFNMGIAYLEPFECEFEFINAKSPHIPNKNGFYGWNQNGIDLPKKPVNKEFYLRTLYGNTGISWPADNFTEKELDVISRFLEEVSDHMGIEKIGSVDILDNEEDNKMKIPQKFYRNGKQTKEENELLDLCELYGNSAEGVSSISLGKTLFCNGVDTIQKLKDIELDDILKFKGVGVKRINIFIKMKEHII